jgi:hypothetical protein
MSTPSSLTGGCLCGAVRYQVTVRPRHTSYCHCLDCQKASGSPLMAWSFIPVEAFSLTCGSLRKITWAGRERGFCADCGSPLTFFDPAFADEMEITTTSLDHPDAFSPGDHNWLEDRRAWFEIGDSLPRFLHNTPASKNSLGIE